MLDIMPFLLLLLLSLTLSIGLTIVILVIRRPPNSENVDRESEGHGSSACPYERTCAFRRPGCWIAVKSHNLRTVQTALGLHNPKPCSWIEGLTTDEKLFIAPPVKGWILVIGSGLPDPSDDVDACFRFLLELSRKLGQVQFFSINPVLHHHAWVKTDGGRIVRAYAWAGKTLWQQGSLTRAEKELELKCFEYGEPASWNSFSPTEALSVNSDRIPLLAARWSLDPAHIDGSLFETERGISGELSRRY